jgi:hypothetical protein
LSLKKPKLKNNLQLKRSIKTITTNMITNMDRENIIMSTTDTKDMDVAQLDQFF